MPGGIEADLDERSMREVGLPGLPVTKRVVEARLSALEERYERSRSAPSSWERTQQLEGLLAEARLLAGAAADRMNDRVRIFDKASDGERAITLGLIRGGPWSAGKDRLCIAWGACLSANGV